MLLWNNWFSLVFYFIQQGHIKLIEIITNNKKKQFHVNAGLLIFPFFKESWKESMLVYSKKSEQCHSLTLIIRNVFKHEISIL